MHATLLVMMGLVALQPLEALAGEPSLAVPKHLAPSLAPGGVPALGSRPQVTAPRLQLRPPRLVGAVLEELMYVPDYVGLGVLTGLSIGLYARPPPPNSHAIIGPTYDPEQRDTTDVRDRRWNGVINRSHRPDTVHPLAPTVLGSVAILSAAGLSFARKPVFRKLHHAALGAVQAQLAAFVATELLKSGVGRLRPDFRDRMARYYCEPGGEEPPQGVDCSGVEQEAARLESRGWSTRGAYLSEKDFQDGRRSFPSGHTVAAFVTATYLTLLVGGEFVWGPEATGPSRLLGIAAQMGALATATAVGLSRMTDHRHHVEDVVAGAGLGAISALASYAVYFDPSGQPRTRTLWFQPMVNAVGAGVSFGGVFP